MSVMVFAFFFASLFKFFFVISPEPNNEKLFLFTNGKNESVYFHLLPSPNFEIDSVYVLDGYSLFISFSDQKLKCGSYEIDESDSVVVNLKTVIKNDTLSLGRSYFVINDYNSTEIQLRYFSEGFSENFVFDKNLNLKTYFNNISHDYKLVKTIRSGDPDWESNYINYSEFSERKEIIFKP